MTAGKQSLPTLILWHLLVLGTMFIVADVRVEGVAFWHSRPEEKIASFYLLYAYAAMALVSIVMAARGRPLALKGLIGVSLSILGLAYFALLINAPLPPYSRALLISLSFVAMVLWLGTLAPQSLHRRLLLLFAVGFLAIAALNAWRTFGPQKQPPMVRTVKNIHTALYSVQLETYQNPIPKSVVRGGAIAVIGDRYLLATGDGRMYTFDWPAGGKFSGLQLLPYKVPFNPDSFEAASHTKWAPGDANTDHADAVKGVQTWQFRVADVLVGESGDHVQIFTSHHWWNDKDKCFTVRVSMLEGSRADVLAGRPLGDWKTLFEASPCLPLTGPDSLHSNNPFGGMEIGGRMQLLSPDELLLTVGDHDFSGLETPRTLADDPTAMYGKTILIHLQDRSSEIFTSGHRNPQGLFRDSSGIIWETEHGPQGGDELNILNKGSHYGWPRVSYGTDYGSSVWPLNAHQGRHDGYVVPAFAWVPSIGVSSLLRLQGNAFPDWKDDLLVGSLHARTLFRMRIEGRTPVYAEPIPLDERIRDIVEGPDGQILMWTDTYNLMSLQPSSGTNGAVLFGNRCGGCHKIDNGLNNSFGPDLYQIVGKNAGTNANFDAYSPAMKGFGKEWTRERLDAFIKEPQAVVPGTAMSFGGLKDDKERAAVIEFLTNGGD